jgi:ribonuclease BN (tRNA processing enzyme)
VKIQLLPSSFDSQGRASVEQRLTCFLIDDCVAVDAGSIAIALSDDQRRTVRDVIVTHPHLDHIASLPIFVDDLFSEVQSPIRIHATQEVIDLLDRDVFNDNVYPRFPELKNQYGHVLTYVPFRTKEEFRVAHLKIKAVAVNHIVPTVGLVVSDEKATVAFSSDTAKTDGFWDMVNSADRLDALFIEASFPNSMAVLAETSGHLTPATLSEELRKFSHNGTDILTVHLKAAYRAQVKEELDALGVPRLSVMEPGRIYEW